MAAFSVVSSGRAAAAGAAIEPRRGVSGGELTTVEVDGQKVAWSARGSLKRKGPVELRWTIDTGASSQIAVEVPVCAGRREVLVDGAPASAPDAGPVVVALSAGQHVVSARLTVSDYERRVACGEPARAGTPTALSDGLLRVTFDSPHASAGGGHAVAFVPRGHDPKKAGPLLLMPHPWNGSPWTYAAYAELLDEASTRDVLLLFPSGLGNSLYTAPAEDEVLRALDAFATTVAVDRSRVSIAGASMGGAGATTIGFHAPDRFATITSFFGDARYDLATYVRAILRDDAGAHRVNAADVAENVREVPVWLIHGEEDRVSPIAQSELLSRALEGLGYRVRFDRVAGLGHSGAIVARYACELVDRAAEARAPEYPARVTYRSVRAADRGAYGVRLERAHEGDAFLDIERAADGRVHVRRADNVRAITLAPGALGAAAGAPVVVDGGASVKVEWAGASSAAR